MSEAPLYRFGIGLLQGPTREQFLMSEVPLYRLEHTLRTMPEFNVKRLELLVKALHPTGVPRS